MSLAVGAILNFGILSLTAWTIKIIIVAGDRYNCFDLGHLLAQIPIRALGVVSEWLINALVALVNVLALIGYVIVICDALAPILPSSGYFSERWHLVVVSCSCLLPVCFLKQEYLAFTSAASVCTNAYLISYITVLLIGSGPASDVCMFGLSTGGVAYFSAMAYSMSIQMCVLPMYEELADRTPEKFMTAVYRSFTFLFFVLTAFASIGYLLYGPDVQSNILQNLPHTPFGDLARLSMLFVVLGVFPLMLYPIIAPVRHWQKAHFDHQPHVRATHADAETLLDPVQSIALSDADFPSSPRAEVSCCGHFMSELCSLSGAFTLCVLAIVTALGIVYTNLATMNIFSGTVCVFGFVGLAPSLVGVFLSSPIDANQGPHPNDVVNETAAVHDSPTPPSNYLMLMQPPSLNPDKNLRSLVNPTPPQKTDLAMWGLLLFSVLCAVTQVLYTSNDAKGLEAHCVWFIS